MLEPNLAELFSLDRKVSLTDIELPYPIKPALSLESSLVHVKTIPAGATVGYGATYTAQKEEYIATVPIGYADGVSRNLSNKIFAFLNGKKIKQIGNITMDQIIFDLDNLSARTGDIISFFDGDYTIDEWAKLLNTINYELTCRLKVRLPRVYTR